MYIDVRSTWPVLFIGMRAFQLKDASRSITVEQAVKMLKKAGEL